MDSIDGIAFINGELMNLCEAKIPINDRGFLFGHSVFETILFANGKIISLEKHLQRLKNSCKRSFIREPDEDNLKELLTKAIQQNLIQNKSLHSKISIRIIITGGNSFQLAINKNNNQLPPSNIIIICKSVSGPSPKQYQQGIALKSVYDVRPPEMIDIKSSNYLFNIIACENALEEKFDDVLFYNKKGEYTESSTANFIWFDSENTINSAPSKNNCLPGTTLNLLIECLQENGMPFRWKALTQNELTQLKGCAIVSSVRLILPVNRIDQIKIPLEQSKTLFTTLNSLLEKKIN